MGEATSTDLQTPPSHTNSSWLRYGSKWSGSAPFTYSIIFQGRKGVGGWMDFLSLTFRPKPSPPGSRVWAVVTGRYPRSSEAAPKDGPAVKGQPPSTPHPVTVILEQVNASPLPLPANAPNPVNVRATGRVAVKFTGTFAFTVPAGIGGTHCVLPTPVTLR